MPAISTQLALMMVRFAQPAPDGSVVARWTLWPEGRRLSYPELCAALEGLPTPVLLGAHAEPGGVTAISLASAAPGARPWLEHEVRNQRAHLRTMADRLAPGNDRVPVLLETDDDALVVSLADVAAWAREYVVTSCGWTLAESGGDTRAPLRLRLRRPDGHWSPGSTCKPPGAAA
jgi:hypothetical protein